MYRYRRSSSSVFEMWLGLGFLAALAYLFGVMILIGCYSLRNLDGFYLGLALIAPLSLYLYSRPSHRSDLLNTVMMILAIGPLIFAPAVYQHVDKYQRACAENVGPNALLDYCNLAGRNLTQVNLAGARLEGANLAGAQLQKSNLTGVDLTKANLEGADLTGAVLDKAILRSSSLDKAKLNNVSLRGADLTRVQLKDTDLSGATLDGVTLDHTDLSEARGARLDFDPMMKALNVDTKSMLSHVLRQKDVRLVSFDALETDLKGVCTGHGVEQASLYTGNANFHPTMDVGSLIVLDNWRPVALEFTELVACGSGNSWRVELCGDHINPFGHVTEIWRIADRVRIQLRSANSGELIAEHMFEGDPDKCGWFLQWYWQLPGIHDSSLGPRMRSWLADYVNPVK